MEIGSIDQQRFRKGFTLIELLVVIAIIAIRAAILFPVFASAREKARQTTCASNMKQLALAVLQYRQDFDDLAPCGTNFRYGSEAPTTGQPGIGWAGQIYPYAKSTAVYTCPDDYTAVTAPSGSTTYSVVSYAWNETIDNMGYGEGQAGATVGSTVLSVDIGGSTLASPSRSVMFSEVQGVNVPNLAAGGETSSPVANGDPTGSTSNMDTGKLGDEGVTWTDPKFQNGRHGNAANYAFWDGHVKYLVGTNVCQGYIAFQSSWNEALLTSVTPSPQNNACGTQGKFANGQTPAGTFSIN